MFSLALPARTTRSAVLLARLLLGPGDWRATPQDDDYFREPVMQMKLIGSHENNVLIVIWAEVGASEWHIDTEETWSNIVSLTKMLSETIEQVMRFLAS